jgi:superkiller protein 3
VNRDHGNLETKVALARAYIAADDLEKGLPMYADPDVTIESSASDILGVANALIKAKRYDEARPWLDKALEKDPNLSEVYATRGLIELVNKNYEAALAAFDKKIEMDPKSASTWINKGNTLLALGKKPEAKEAYRKATEVAPNNPAVWLSLGQALVKETPQEALAAFDRALALEPQSVSAKKWKGLTFLVLERYPDSISLLKEATQADPNDAEGLTWLGNAYESSGNQGEARAAYQRALKVDPAYKPAQESLQQMNASSQ